MHNLTPRRSLTPETNWVESNNGDGGDGFHTVQAEHDLESNWELDLTQKLDEYSGGSNIGAVEADFIQCNKASPRIQLGT
ncbi:hypothetical protein C1H46_028940 [Malus baccata]|uniref:Uncharacterized protein n=1 Tax=Malus baccata TaxID=106549 RepID=A0A540LGC5_MALBA|nr:hypothetical protein C1H46_028940 [Malus baccata]